MEAVAQLPAKKSLSVLAELPLLTFVNGRISSRRRLRGQEGPYFLTVLKTPARDQFSHPGTVELFSHEPLGDAGDDWKGVCEITGYPRSYNSKPDPETGEISRINTAEVRLRVLEQ